MDNTEQLPGTPQYEVVQSVHSENVTVIPSNYNASQKSNTVQAWSLPEGYAENAVYSWPDAPDEDVFDNPKSKKPSYQMTQALQPVPGYERTNVRTSKPHAAPNSAKPVFLKQNYLNSLPDPLSEVEAEIALKGYSSGQCCRGKKGPPDIKVDKIINLPIHQYKLRTFTETRQTIRVFEPYHGQTIDRFQNQGPPTVWEIINEPDNLWKKHTKACILPQSSTVEICHGCTGRGFNRCYRCQGRGKTLCKKCKGTGKLKELSCGICTGSGHPMCQLCRGHACIQCTACEGNKHLHFYINIISTFELLENETVLNKTKVPNKNIAKIHKVKLLESEDRMVPPIADYPFSYVNQESSDLSSKHSSDPTKRIVKQYHILFGLSAVEGSYRWKNKLKSFWVYGDDNRVYAPSYPDSCKDRCTLM